MYIPNRAEQRLNVLLSGEKFSCQGKSTPAPPDYRAAAEETAAGNMENLEYQTAANRPDQYTPFGNTQWTQDDAGKWTQTTSLDPNSQRALDAQLKLSGDKSELAGGMYGRLEEDFKDPMDFSNLPEWGDVPQAGNLTPEQLQRGVDFSGAEQRTNADELRQSSEDAIYGRATSRLDPQWQQRSDQKEAQLAAQGLRPGDPAYDQAMENMGRERTDAYQQASYGAIMGGGQEAQRQQGMQLAGREQDMGEIMSGANFANTAAGQAFGQEATAGGQNFGQQTSQSGQQSQQRQAQLVEEMTKRGMNLNEINAIISGQQVGMPSMPGFNTAGYTAGADYTGAAKNTYGAEMDAFNADQAMWNSLMQGAGMAGGAMMSDRRLKRHINRVGEYMNYPLYLFQYVWGAWAVGVMADEINQDAVTILPNGFAAVDYSRIK